MPSRQEDSKEPDISPLLVIDGVHRYRYGTIKLLEKLFYDLPAIFPQLPRDSQFMARLYLQRLIIELACQYVEEVGRYSKACLETGLLYAQRVISVTTGEVGSFYSKTVADLTDSDIRKIFNVSPDVQGAPALDLSEIRTKFNNLREFRAKYHGLYNAVKHGSGVLHNEFSTRDKPMQSRLDTHVSYQWFEVRQGRPQRLTVRTGEGSHAETEIIKSRMKTEIVRSDSVDEFVRVSEDCYQIIAQILQNHALHAQHIEG